MPARLALAAVLTFALAGAARAAPPDADGPTIPVFEASPRCTAVAAKAGSSEEEACELIRDLPPLEAAPGARVYRLQWWMGFVEHPRPGQPPRPAWFAQGPITLTVDKNGNRTLQTPWHRGSIRLKPDQLPDFERDLARSDFHVLSTYNGLENIVCVDGESTSVEALVNGRYKREYFEPCSGVFSTSLANALDQLMLFALADAGRTFPYRPDHPVFRGFGTRWRDDGIGTWPRRPPKS
jgi:hypothetical protein